MINAQHPLQSVLASLSTPERGDGRAPVITMTAAHTGVGTSYVTRTLALLAAQHHAPQYGQVQGPYDATFGQEPFWQVSPDGVDEMGRRKSAALYGGLNLIGNTALAVTEFRWSEIKAGQSVHIRHAREYWHGLRDQFAMVIVDTPVVGEADKTVLICSPETAKLPAQKLLSDRINAAQGRCAGLVINEGPARAHSQLG